MSSVRSIKPIRILPAVLAGVLSSSIVFTLSGCQHAPSPEVLATVNGKEILASELDRIYKQNLDPAAPAPSKEEAAMRRLQLLHGLIEDEILQQRAARLNLVATDEEVDAKITEFKAPLTQEEFDRQLKERNQTLEDLRRDIRHQLTQSKLVNKEIESKINITDGEISTYFNAHKSEFNLIEPQYHLGRILVTNEPSKQVTNLQNDKAGNDAEAKKKIQALKNRLDSGEDFGSVAMNFSENPETASSGGDIGFVGESQMHSDPAIYAAVTKLKPGQITEILPLLDAQTKKPAGYAIYKLVSREPAGQRELSDPRVQQAIRQQLHDGRSQLLKSAYLEMLHDQAKIENFFAEQIFKNDAH